MDDDAVSRLPPHFPCGVFYGFANVNHGEVYGMVTSIGWNPHFKNEKKTIVCCVEYICFHLFFFVSNRMIIIQLDYQIFQI